MWEKKNLSIYANWMCLLCRLSSWIISFRLARIGYFFLVSLAKTLINEFLTFCNFILLTNITRSKYHTSAYFSYLKRWYLKLVWFLKWGLFLFWTNIAAECTENSKKKPVSKWIIRILGIISYRFAGLNECFIRFQHYSDWQNKRKTKVEEKRERDKEREGKMLWQLISDTEARVKYLMSFIIE